MKIFLIFLMLFFSVKSYTHSGRTNSSGCHNNRKTGGYHCHRYSPQSQKNSIFNSSEQKINRTINSYQENPIQLHSQVDDTITCQLEYLARVSYKDGKITRSTIKEKAKSPTVFSELKSKNPKMLQPDAMNLIKIKENNGIYWLLSPNGTSATVIFIVDINRKIVIQQRSADLPGLSLYSQSWMGKCL